MFRHLCAALKALVKAAAVSALICLPATAATIPTPFADPEVIRLELTAQSLWPQAYQQAAEFDIPHQGILLGLQLIFPHDPVLTASFDWAFDHLRPLKELAPHELSPLPIGWDGGEVRAPAPVPLPAPFWLLGGALLMLLRRR